jgi:hypothetical protein
MMSRLWRAWRRDEGGWASPEWALVVTVLVLGAITGQFLSKQSRLALDEPAAVQSR